MNPLYYGGRHRLEEFHLFAFPRTGSHFLVHVLMGLFDIVAVPQPHLRTQEALDRQLELDPVMLYALNLREDGVPFHPIYINSLSNGMHGLPAKGNAPAMLLIRDPIATVYSLYHTGIDRWGFRIEDPVRWIEETLNYYITFYDTGVKMLTEHPRDTLLIKWEDLVESPAMVQQIVDFIGTRPKLAVEFVHRVTRFDILARGGSRTFYRGGSNLAWRSDASWIESLRNVSPKEFTRFGYPCFDPRTLP